MCVILCAHKNTYVEKKDGGGERGGREERERGREREREGGREKWKRKREREGGRGKEREGEGKKPHVLRDVIIVV